MYCMDYSIPNVVLLAQTVLLVGNIYFFYKNLSQHVLKSTELTSIALFLCQLISAGDDWWLVYIEVLNSLWKMQGWVLWFAGVWMSLTPFVSLKETVELSQWVRISGNCSVSGYPLVCMLVLVCLASLWPEMTFFRFGFPTLAQEDSLP